MKGPSGLERRIIAFCGQCAEISVAAFGEIDEQVILTIPGQTSGPRLLATRAALQRLGNEDLLIWKDDRLQLTKIGHLAFKRQSAPEDEAFLQQHRVTTRKRMRTDTGWEVLSVNERESPLARLHARAAGDGRTWVSDAGFAAGERLRRDFEFGNLRQNVSSNWNLAGGSSRSSVNGAQADLSDSALDARSRLEQAVAVLGPDLSGVVLDVCCFLKGLEGIERERRWPPRSAKLMLRTGLDLLAAHYGTRAGRAGPATMRVT